MCWPTITIRRWRCRWRNRARTNDLDAHARFIRDLERRGKLDRAVEFLPDDDALRDRAKEDKGLTRPELAVLLAYAKLDLDAEIDRERTARRSLFRSELAGYFPPAAVKRLPQELQHHRLRREIISTVLANRIVNLAGPVFVPRMKEMSGAPTALVARAFVVAEGAFGLSALKSRIDALDYRVDANVQIRHVCRHRGIAAAAGAVVSCQRARRCRTGAGDHTLSWRGRSVTWHLLNAGFRI